jgi:hypothetical protein
MKEIGGRVYRYLRKGERPGTVQASRAVLASETVGWPFLFINTFHRTIDNSHVLR